MIRNFYGSIVWALALIASASIAGRAAAQQRGDHDIEITVERPAHVDRAPRVFFDEAHRNFHTTTGRYQPFVRLMTADGCKVKANKVPFTTESLAEYEVLVIANAAAPRGEESAFTDEECDAVAEWVRQGGSLLLIADHTPFGGAARALASRFDVEMSNAYTIDAAHKAPGDSSASWLFYSDENGLLGEHPIISGRDPAERIRRVVTFTGQSLRGPEGSTTILKLADSAVDRLRIRDPDGSVIQQRTSAAGRGQLIAFHFGDGRVVVSGEAAMLTAQVVQRATEADPIRIGFTRVGNDNKQFALNIMRWLTRVLEPVDDPSAPVD